MDDAIAPSRNSNTETRASSPSRAVVTTNAPARNDGNTTNYPSRDTASNTALIPQRATTRSGNYPVRETSSTMGGGSTPSSGTGATNGNSNGFYGNGNPFAILSDIFRNVYGPDNPVNNTSPSVISVPVGASGGGSGNMVLILGILGLAGFGVYWFYFRKGN